MSVRSAKVASVIKEELGVLFQRNFSMSEYGLITISDVEMSPDLHVARVYVSIFGDENRKKKSLAMLESQKTFLRSSLGKALRLRFTPEIVFMLDDTIDRAMKIEGIFRKIHENDGSQSTPEEPAQS